MVNLFDRFKKCKFLCTQGGKPKKFTLQGANQNFFTGGKTKLALITGGINLFIQLFNVISYFHISIYFKINLKFK
jgi:hypothetical protein